MRRFAFTVPRFGKSIAGGAETLAGALARQLHLRGDDVEIWTTCARDNRTWENEYPEGDTEEFGLRVRRFPVDARNLDVWIPRQINIHQGLRLSVEDQLVWMREGVNSAPLYRHIEKHAPSLHAVFFAPYLFGTTFFGALVHPEKSILIPCLHDENYAYTEIMQSLFRQVKGCLFNSEPEQELARMLYGDVRGGDVGMGFDASGSPEREPYFKEPFPYVLYVGRKETGKNVQVLIDSFCAYKDAEPGSRMKLVIVGGGEFSDLHRPQALERGDIADLSHVTEEEKQSLIQHSLFVCQPSQNESFSIVLMEAWLQGVPVVVSAGCPVTKRHVIESGGGLYFASSDDFAGICEELARNDQLRCTLGAAGRRYVEKKFNWKAVLERFDQVVEEVLNPFERMSARID